MDDNVAAQLLIFSQQIAELRASVFVLKASLAIEMNPDHPEKALALFQKLEQKFLDLDPDERQRKEAAETIEAVMLWKKHGGGHEA